MQTRTTYVTFESLRTKGPSAATVVRLMMACNDMALANEGLQRAFDELTGKLKFKRQGALQYFSRLESSHLMEGFAVIEDIRADPQLKPVIAACDAQAQAALQYLGPYLPGGARRHEFNRWCSRVRNSLTFHYDEGGTQTMAAIEDRASRGDSNQTSVTRGDRMHNWRWNVADDVVDSIIVRQIWNIPRDRDLETEVNKIVDEIHQIVLRFIDFSGEFIWKYVRR